MIDFDRRWRRIAKVGLGLMKCDGGLGSRHHQLLLSQWLRCPLTRPAGTLSPSGRGETEARPFFMSAGKGRGHGPARGAISGHRGGRFERWQSLDLLPLAEGRPNTADSGVEESPIAATNIVLKYCNIKCCRFLRLASPSPKELGSGSSPSAANWQKGPPKNCHFVPLILCDKLPVVGDTHFDDFDERLANGDRRDWYTGAGSVESRESRVTVVGARPRGPVRRNFECTPGS